MSKVCIDACLAVKWLVPEEDSSVALDLLTNWVTTGTQLIAPPLLLFEVFSTIRRLQFKGTLSTDKTRQILLQFKKIKIELPSPPNLFDEALKLAARYNRPTVYDTSYLALARLVDCEFWTADQRLLNSLGRKPSRVHHLGEVGETKSGTGR
ncbi:MAG: type II toxin-antitoxin system VapC family toxin [Syntrophothermus sp.]